MKIADGAAPAPYCHDHQCRSPWCITTGADGGMAWELRQPLGIALIGGLLVSQVQAMFTTSALYLLVGRF
ncbi:MAG: hypothetical protein ABF739_08155 [Acetobacter okinawensis]|uniref:hypothetical protein n=1 Tax=Acetobacter okinawensis TaxID=1076594 RepID=UPI0039E9F1CC